jgi:hypothetical protein
MSSICRLKRPAASREERLQNQYSVALQGREHVALVFATRFTPFEQLNRRTQFEGKQPSESASGGKRAAR